MPRLVLLNGAPGSGKSTLARRLAETLPLSLVLDIDTVRGWLGRWADDPGASGVAARRLALVMAATHLSSDRDVIVPQFLQRPTLVEQLHAVASTAHAQFVEVALVSSAEEAAARFASRGSSTEHNHADARLLQAAPGAESIERMYEGMLTMLRGRPATRYVRSIPGAVDATFDELLRALGSTSTGDAPSVGL